jgi:hypothetical protein
MAAQDTACNRYRTRLDAHLATLTDDAARRRFLDREYERWQTLYQRFEADSSILPGATAFDFFITLSDISVRQIRYGHALVRAA